MFFVVSLASPVFAHMSYDRMMVADSLGDMASVKFKEFVTMDTMTASVCSSGKKSLVAASLWMQMGSHGHGSTPISLKKDGDCVGLAGLNFVMTGDWAIRLTFDDGAKAEAAIPVAWKAEEFTTSWNGHVAVIWEAPLGDAAQSIRICNDFHGSALEATSENGTSQQSLTISPYSHSCVLLSEVLRPSADLSWNLTVEFEKYGAWTLDLP
jgi:hypothetical protein